MIVPMKQLLLLCSSRAKTSALAALRALGCVHVALEVRDSEAIRQASSALSASERALRILDVAEKNGTFAFRPEASSPIASLDLTALLATAKEQAAKPVTTVDEVNLVAEMVTRLREEAFALRLEETRYAPFAEVNPATMAKLASAGLPVTLFKVPESTTDLPAGAFTFATEAGFTYGAWVSPEPLPAACEVIPTPTRSTTERREALGNALVEADDLVAALCEEAPKVRPALQKALAACAAERTAAEVATNLRDEGAVAYLKGYIPEPATEALTQRAAEEGWGLLLAEPDPEDPNVPVLLEPPKGFRAIGTLFKGLGILPGYSEGDCSVPFYVFFSIFFAMLVGDAGYGAIMLAGTLAAAAKFRKNAAAKPVFLILTVFCLATIVWGILSGTYFGIAKEALPCCLKCIPTVAWLGQDANIMFLCFLIGAVHISVARLWNAALLFPNIKFIGQIGWLGVTWSMFLIVCGIVVSWFASPAWTWYMLGGSVVLILIALISDIRHEAVNIGMLPLNVISAMGDIISYVRLFAVGLASVKVAENFNSMALGLDLPLVVRVIAVAAILLVGHGLNLAMGALSILVHAVRLNTLEFSNAKGITWAGQPYTPFRKPEA